MKSFNYEMKRKYRKIVVILDNCPSHPSIELSNIKMIYLPPNTTSVLQPMEAGVIHSIKSKYRLLLCQKLLALLEVKVDPSPKDFNLFDAILMLNKSWSEVRTETIENCFKKCGFSSDATSDINSLETPEIGWDSITESLGVTGLEFQDFVTADDDITNELISQTTEVTEQSDNTLDFDDTDIYVIDSEEPESTVKLIDGINSISVLRKCLYQSEGDIDSYLEMIDEIENFVFKSMSNQKQTKITDYFHK